MLKMYGIANCDTVKKARVFLESRGIAYEFVDFKKTPPSLEQLKRWQEAFGDWPLNKKGPTFRKNQDAFEKLTEAKRPAFIVANSSMIKRPILENKNKVLAFGFDEESYRLLAK